MNVCLIKEGPLSSFAWGPTVLLAIILLANKILFLLFYPQYP